MRSSTGLAPRPGPCSPLSGLDARLRAPHASPLPPAVSPSVSVPPRLCVSASLCLPISISPCLCVSPSLCLRISVSPRLCLSLHLCLPVSLSLPVSVSPRLSVFPHFCAFPFPCLSPSLSLPVSLSPPPSLSLCLSPQGSPSWLSPFAGLGPPVAPSLTVSMCPLPGARSPEAAGSSPPPPRSLSCSAPAPLSQPLGPVPTVCPRLPLVLVAGTIPALGHLSGPWLTTLCNPRGIWAGSGQPSGRLDSCQLLSHQQEIVFSSKHLWKLTQHPRTDRTVGSPLLPPAHGSCLPEQSQGSVRRPRLLVSGAQSSRRG